MKKTLIALMALAGVACGASYEMTKGGDLYAGEFTLTFTIPDMNAVTGDYDILAAYYQVNGSYGVNAFVLSSDGTLTLSRGQQLSNTSELGNDVTINVQNSSTFTTDGTTAYTLGAGDYTISYLGGTNGSAAAKLILNGEEVASFTGGNHNMNGVQNGGNNLYLITNDAYSVVATSYPGMPNVPEPATATLSLLALAGLAARRRRK